MGELDGRRICIVLLTGLGDVVHGLPVANALKAAGAAHITWIAEPAPSWVVRPHPNVDDVVVYHKKNGVRGVTQLAKDLRGRSFDITLNLNVYFKSVWPTLLSGAKRRIGFARARSHDGVWLSVNEHLTPRPRAHTQGMFLEFLPALGVAVPETIEWRITFTAAEQAARRAFFAPFERRPVVAIVPASANPKKDWLPERWAALVDALANEFDAHTLIAGGPSDRERMLAGAITRAATTKPVIALANDVRRMMWLVSGSSLVIAPDTGPLHVARACDVPVIGLYGHTNPWRVGPYRKYEDLWIDAYTEPSEAPDASNATPKLERMQTITADDVMQRVRTAFARYGTGTHA